MPARRPYSSDLSDARWELIEPVLSAWRFERRGRALDFGRPPEHDLREIMNVILYVDRTGVQRRCLPHDFPHWNTVYGYFAKWTKEGVSAELNGLLRQRLRQREGRDRPKLRTVVPVPGSDQQRQRFLPLLGREVDLRGQAAPGASEAVVVRLGVDPAGRLALQIPFLRAPAACWWARQTVESTLTSQVIRPCASAWTCSCSRIRFQVPSRCHRRNRS